MERKDVYELIDGERAYQNGLNSLTLSVGEEIALTIKYVDKALDEWTNDFTDDEERVAMAMLRKVAAIAVRAMENHGAPPRR